MALSVSSELHSARERPARAQPAVSATSPCRPYSPPCAEHDNQGMPRTLKVRHPNKRALQRATVLAQMSEDVTLPERHEGERQGFHFRRCAQVRLEQADPEHALRPQVERLAARDRSPSPSPSPT